VSLTSRKISLSSCIEFRRSIIWRARCRSRSWRLLCHSVRYNRWRRSVIETVGVIAFTLPSWRRTRTERLLRGISMNMFLLPKEYMHSIGTKAREPARCCEQRRKVDVRVLIYSKINSMLVNVFHSNGEFYVTYCLEFDWIYQKIVMAFLY